MFFTSEMGKQLIAYGRESVREVKKVVWPTRKEALQMTGYVFAFVVVMAALLAPWVAPYGATEGRFGTNPICFGFPSNGDPVIWDIGTAAIMHGEVVLARRLGQDLPEGVAFDADGHPTRSPDAALRGAIVSVPVPPSVPPTLSVSVRRVRSRAPARPPSRRTSVPDMRVSPLAWMRLA